MNCIHHFPVDFINTTNIEITSCLKEKWTGAMLDQSGSGYCGSLRLDFSSCDEKEVVIAVAKTLSRHPILAARFVISDGDLVGSAPTEEELFHWLEQSLSSEGGTLDDKTFVDTIPNSVNWPGLRVAKGKREDVIYIWIGFWTFTCDGTSIDLLVEEIIQRLQGKHTELTLPWRGYEQKQSISIDPSLKQEIYPTKGPYGVDAIANLTVNSNSEGESFPFSLSVNTDQVRQLAREYRVTPFMLTFAAFQKALSEVTNLSTVITGVPFSNRLSAYEFRAVGPFSSTIPVTTTYDTSHSFLEDIRSANDALMKASKRQRVTSSQLYPNGISPRSADYSLPFAQIFNAWNSKKNNQLIYLENKRSVKLTLLHNSTARSGFEITLDDSDPVAFGRIDMNKNIPIRKVEDILERIDFHLNWLRDNKICYE
ncbi:condensation domain-containing protein [Vibrio mangrovi]|uniref:Condensation domain-containing protein n=1 Tax=Vibrio mangrovi TaxID=474394 RepID=A0A1Y6IPW3_9VIBR|nr:condensation domain-containing protein [Vibrio mangrovi]MDW6003519.1 condensation domain-containing protein [Vibrio mangrovi]SMR99687.1 Surfactin synthase subunit 1 [Vibrio mangrovi]